MRVLKQTYKAFNCPPGSNNYVLGIDLSNDPDFLALSASRRIDLSRPIIIRYERQDTPGQPRMIEVSLFCRLTSGPTNYLEAFEYDNDGNSLSQIDPDEFAIYLNQRADLSSFEFYQDIGAEAGPAAVYFPINEFYYPPFGAEL